MPSELDKELAGYIIFKRALFDAFENGLDKTTISNNTPPSRYVVNFKQTEPDSDFTFAFIARAVEDYDIAKSILDFDETLESRNDILIRYSKYLSQPDSRKTNGDKSRAWGMDFESQVLPVLQFMNKKAM